MDVFKRYLRSFLLSLIGVPLLAHGAILLAVGLFLGVKALCGLLNLDVSSELERLLTLASFIIGGMLMLVAGRLLPLRNADVAFRQMVLMLPAVIIGSAWVTIVFLSGLSFNTPYYEWLFWFNPVWAVVNFMALLTGWYWGMVIIPVGTQICFTLGYWWRHHQYREAKNVTVCRNAMVFVLLAICIVAAWQAKMRGDKYAYVDTEHTIGEQLNTYYYRPNIAGNKLTPLRGTAPFGFTENRPRLDGATAAYPLYASAFFALNTFPDDMPYYQMKDCCLAISRTPEAYKKIIADKADIIFVAQPSEGQKKLAQQASVKLTYTPFAREAFVMIAHADNPVTTLSQQQVRDIFSGKITHWNEVGGDKRPIAVWQRPQDSGSQSTMLAKVMKETPMLPPKETEVAQGMGGVIRKVAEYQNSRGAIGYTFRYYATKMNSNVGIKLLAIDGVEPTVETIRNGSYPFVVDVYMVTRESPTNETQKLVAWFLSPQGQGLVEDVGYVPLYDTTQ